MKAIRKKIMAMVGLGTLLVGSQSAFATVIGEVQAGGAVAYCGIQRIVNVLDTAAEIQIVDMPEELAVYTIEQEGSLYNVAKDTIRVTKVIETVEIADIKVREKANGESTIIHTPAIGETLEVVGKTSNENWYQVIL